ncbi:hypothetical protein ACHAXR_006557 [Thalassiosira sp. AJA248-18]
MPTFAGKAARSNRESSRHPSKQPTAKILPPQLRAGASSSYYESNGFENVWLSEMLSHEKTRNEILAKADLLNFTELPGSTVHPHAANHHLIRQAKCNKRQSPKGGKSIPDHERQRLDQLTKTLKKTTAKSKAKKDQKKFTPYVEANSKIARVLQHTKPKEKREAMQASQLDDFYKLVTRETSAAVILQSQWRRVLAAECVSQIALETRQATKIQSFVRGLFARELLKRLKEEKQKATSTREQFVRLYVARCRRRKRIKVENDSAVLCQSAIRMFLAKQVAQLRRLQQSWEENQQRWRAISTRLAWKDLRINFYARQIQCVVRRKLAKKRVSAMFVAHTEAALCIQSIWRRYLAWTKMKDVVYQLSVDQRCTKIRIIASEHRYWKQQVEEMTKPSKIQLKKDLEVQKVNLEKEQCEKCEQIHALESHYKDQLQLQQQITPRAIAGGWEEQVKINLNDTRERITTAKLHLFFGVQKKLKSVVKELEQIQRSEDDAIASMDHWSTWQQVEQDRLWDFQRQHDKEVEEREKRHSIISEQMRWAVKHHVASGKPDKRRPLRHLPSGTDDDRGSGDRVQQMIEAVKLKADDFQAANHLTMFQPFNKMWMQFNSLATNDNLVQKENGNRMRTPNTLHADLTHQIPHQENVFPSKLPWDLLEKVREERAANATDGAKC